MTTELLNRQRWKTRVELANAMFEYLEIFHNRQRRHSSIGMLTPIEYEKLHQNPFVAAMVDNELTDFVPYLRAGRRAPHVWLDDAETQSVLDLFGRGFVLLTTGAGDRRIHPGLERLVGADANRSALNRLSLADWNTLAQRSVAAAITCSRIGANPPHRSDLDW